MKENNHVLKRLSANAQIFAHRQSYALNIADAIIASTAREMALKLVTRNIKHYPVKDIEVIRPY